MASNSFGDVFRITTFGESHGIALGVIVDGCPSGLSISEDEINLALNLRCPGRNEFVTPRKEKDKAKIIAGIFEEKTTGAPIAIIIENTGYDSSKYEPIKKILRPGHANFTYLRKYGVFDYRGGGRASARETVCRVAAGAIAAKLLKHYGIQIAAFIKSIGCIEANIEIKDFSSFKEKVYNQLIFCPDEKSAKRMMNEIKKIKNEGDSIGGVVEFIVTGVPVGLGDPIYNKLEAKFASAMMSIPASKGFEIGEGFDTSKIKGSQNNDEFMAVNRKFITKTNFAGGVLAGISNGMPIVGRVAFKPTPSIMKAQNSVDLEGKKVFLQLPQDSRHDVCVAIRAVPVVEAMCALVIADALMLNRCVKLDDKN